MEAIEIINHPIKLTNPKGWQESITKALRKNGIMDIELKENEVNDIDTTGINFRKFIRHIFEYGTRDKRELIGSANDIFYLKDKRLMSK